MHRFTVALLLFLVVVIPCLGASSKAPPFRFTTKRSSDTVDVNFENEKAVFSIRSPTGISSVTIERLDEAWPQKVVLHLHLAGLENLRISNGEATLSAVVSSQNGKVRVWKDGQEESPLDANSPLWMTIRMVGADGKETKAIPLKNGYFQISLPNAFFEKNPKSISASWINFYRN